MSILRSFDDAPSSASSTWPTGSASAPAPPTASCGRSSRLGLLDQDPRTERYRLGVGLAELGCARLQRLGVEAARPLLEELAAETGESVNLGVRHGGEVLVVLRGLLRRIPCGSSSRRQSRAGAHVGDGQGILAWAPRSGRGGRRARRAPGGVTRRGRSRRAALSASCSAPGARLRRERRGAQRRRARRRRAGPRPAGVRLGGLSVQGPTVPDHRQPAARDWR